MNLLRRLASHSTILLQVGGWVVGCLVMKKVGQLRHALCVWSLVESRLGLVSSRLKTHRIAANLVGLVFYAY